MHLTSTHGELPSPWGCTQQTASLIVDVDGNGVQDFVVACRDGAPSVAWYRRVGNGWERALVEASALPVEAGGDFHDIDGDGDLEVVSIGWTHGKVVVYENRAVVRDVDMAVADVAQTLSWDRDHRP